jgi:hypothetical protein
MADKVSMLMLEGTVVEVVTVAEDTRPRATAAKATVAHHHTRLQQLKQVVMDPNTDHTVMPRTVAIRYGTC